MKCIRTYDRNTIAAGGEREGERDDMQQNNLMHTKDMAKCAHILMERTLAKTL